MTKDTTTEAYSLNRKQTAATATASRHTEQQTIITAYGTNQDNKGPLAL